MSTANAVEPDDAPMEWPSSVVVVGGGRWARVLAGELCRLAPTGTSISIQTRNNVEATQAWRCGRPELRGVTVCCEWTPLLAPHDSAVIVANAARDHAPAVERALACGVPTLVEKPVALTGGAARALAELASVRNVPLAASHVFLFARYLERLRERIDGRGGAKRLRIAWTDATGEERHGERKSYDASLPLYADVLPHIVAIASALVPRASIVPGALRVSRGGAQLEIEFALGRVECTAFLERNAGERRRAVEVLVDGGLIHLDFSKEPGSIAEGPSKSAADPEWETGMRPVARMLTAFLRTAAARTVDPRLDVAIGVAACELADVVRPLYDKSIIPWLFAKLTGPGALEADVKYALTELLQAEGRLCARELERMMHIVVSRARTGAVDGWPHTFLNREEAVAAIRRIAA